MKVTEIEKLFRECAGALPPDARIRLEQGGRKSFSVVDNNGLAVTFYES